VRELWLAYGIAAAMPALLLLVGRAVPFVTSNLHALVAATFIYLSASLLWRRGANLGDAGLSLGQPGKSWLLVVGFWVVVVPLFTIGFGLFYREVCAHFARLAPPGLCPSFRGADAVLHHLRVPRGFGEQVLVELAVVAIPEELFFRGYLHGELEKRWPARRRLWGGGVGRALLASSALFALAHLSVQPDPRRLAVFFPALVFGWMRSATGSIAAGAVTHASANLLMKVLAASYFGG